MKIGFTGDLYLGDIQKYTNNAFKNISNELRDINLVVNLESVALPKDYSMNPIKDKICLKQSFDEASLIGELNPFLVNLSNNHINDYGNSGVDFTKEQLERDGLNYFGVGYSTDEHNVFVFDKKIVFLSYTTRESDQSGSKLFDEQDFQGPKEFSLELFKDQISRYKDYKKIILMHWGIEYFKYPLPSQRELAHEIIDLGGDLIIGNHPHVIRGYEKYKEKYVFYALGNFIFPHIIKRSLFKTVYQEKRNKESILPIFRIEDEVKLEKILKIKANKNFELHLEDSNYNFSDQNIELDIKYYKSFYKRKYKKFKIVAIIKELLKLFR